MGRSITLADWKPTKKQIADVNTVLKTGRLTYGPFTKKFEEEFARLHNFKHAIFVNSGTSGLQLVFDYLKRKHNWKDGDEVIVPAVTFVATVNILLQNRLKPVLVDVDLDTYNIDPALIEKAITKKTRAILPVNLLGRGVQIQEIKEIAKKYKLILIEDSCESMFISYPYTNNPVGSKSDFAVYSSYLAHIISTGVGGIICTNSDKDDAYLRSMIWHGRDNLYLHIDANKEVPIEELIKKRFRFDKVGYSYRLTEFEAALGIDELDRYETILEKRSQNAMKLYDLLAEYIDFLVLPEIWEENSWMFFPIICKPLSIKRDEFALYLEKKGIQTRTIMPLTNQPVYKGMFKEKDYPFAQFINQNGLLLGIHHFLKEADLKYIAKVIGDYVNDKA